MEGGAACREEVRSLGLGEGLGKEWWGLGSPRSGVRGGIEEKQDLSLDFQRDWEREGIETTQKVLRPGEELRQGWGLSRFIITYSDSWAGSKTEELEA